MVGVVVTGKFKNPKEMQTAIEAEKMILHVMNKIGIDVIKGCKAYHLLTHPDGTFAEVSIWESKEKLEKLMNSPMVKKVIDYFNKILENPYKMEIYDDALEMDLAKV